MTINVTPKMAKVYEVLKTSPSWFCTRHIAEALDLYDPSCVLPQLLVMQEAGLVSRDKFGKGYYWTLADNPPADIAARFELAVKFLSENKRCNRFF